MSNPFQKAAQIMKGQVAEEQEESPYRDAAQQMRSDRETQLRTNFSSALQNNPDQYAESVKLSERTNVPVDIVERNRDEVKKKDAINQIEFRKLLDQTPLTADILSDPVYAKLAHDDIENMGTLERFIKGNKAAFKTGLRNLRVGELSTEELFAGGLPDDKREELESLESIEPLDFGGGFIASSFFRAAEQLPNILFTVTKSLQRGIQGGAGFATGAAILGQTGPQVALPEKAVTVPAAAATGFSIFAPAGAFEAAVTIEAGPAYGEFKNFIDETGQPLPDETARIAGAISGVVNGGLEFFGFRSLLKGLPGGEQLLGVLSRRSIKNALKQPAIRKAFNAYTKTLGSELSTELAQEAVTIFSGEIAKKVSAGEFEGISNEDLVSRLREIGVATIQATSILGAPGPIAGFTINTIKARQANRRIETINELAQNSKESKLRERAPEKYKQFVKKLKESGPI